MVAQSPLCGKLLGCQAVQQSNSRRGNQHTCGSLKTCLRTMPQGGLCKGAGRKKGSYAAQPVRFPEKLECARKRLRGIVEGKHMPDKASQTRAVDKGCTKANFLVRLCTMLGEPAL